MPVSRRAKAAPIEYDEGPSDITMDDEYDGDDPVVDLSSQSVSSKTTAAKKAPKKTTKATVTKKASLSKKTITETKSDILKVSTGRYAGPVRRMGLSKRAVPKDPPSPVRISK